MQNPALVDRGSKTRLLRPPLKVYSFSTPDPPFHQSIGRQGNSPPPSSSKEFFFDIISDNGSTHPHCPLKLIKENIAKNLVPAQVATDFDHIKQCTPVLNVNSGTVSETSCHDFGNQN